MNDRLINATINPDVRAGVKMNINAKMTPIIASAINHPHPFTPFLCSSAALPIPQIDWNITQNPTKYANTTAITAGDIDSNIIPKSKSIIPLASVHPQPFKVFLLDMAKIISNMPLTKKLTANTIANAAIVAHGDAMHQIPKPIASRPIISDTHQYLTACFTEKNRSFFITVLIFKFLYILNS